MLDDIQGEMTIYEVNGGNRNWTPFERFIGRVSTVLKVACLIAAPFVCVAAMNWTVR